MNADPHTITPTTQTPAHNLPALAAIETALLTAGLHPEASICTGLLDLIAWHVENETLPASDEHAAARAVLERGDSEDDFAHIRAVITNDGRAPGEMV
jgi:hypothetical protein